MLRFQNFRILKAGTQQMQTLNRTLGIHNLTFTQMYPRITMYSTSSQVQVKAFSEQTSQNMILKKDIRVAPVKSKATLKMRKLLKKLRPMPEPPAPEMCCGAGCDTCVWDTFGEALEDYSKRAKCVRILLQMNKLPITKSLEKSTIDNLFNDLVQYKSILEFKRFEKLLGD